ncbi:MAG: hypothetical protein K0R14_9 [Burkholderiales bacterium]|jgi:hypothetical protein|nr:hypothetical protein [Burkholderiales bacterium]
MKRLIFTCISGIVLIILSNSALAKLPNLSGLYNCRGWDYIEGNFKDTTDMLQLQTSDKDSTGHEIQGYKFTIKNYSPSSALYQGFAVTSDGIHMAVYFSNTAPNASTDYASIILTFSSKHNVTSYSGSYYQPHLVSGEKTHDYGNVTCKRISQTILDK